MVQLKSIMSALPPKYRVKIALVVHGTDMAEHLYYRTSRDIPQPYLAYDCVAAMLKTRTYHIALPRPDSNSSDLSLIEVLLTCTDYAIAPKLTIALDTVDGITSRYACDWETALREHYNDIVLSFDETTIKLEGR